MEVVRDFFPSFCNKLYLCVACGWDLDIEYNEIMKLRYYVHTLRTYICECDFFCAFNFCQ